MCWHKLCLEELSVHCFYTKHEKKKVFSGNGTQPLLPIIVKFGVTRSGCNALAEIRPKYFNCCELPTTEIFLFTSIIYHNKRDIAPSNKSRHKTHKVGCNRCYRYNKMKHLRRHSLLKIELLTRLMNELHFET